MAAAQEHSGRRGAAVSPGCPSPAAPDREAGLRGFLPASGRQRRPGLGPPPAPRRGCPAGHGGLCAGGGPGSTRGGAAPSSPPERGPASRARAHRPLPAPPRARAHTDGTRRPVTCRRAAGGGRGSWLRSPLSPLLTPTTPRLPREGPATTPTVFGGTGPPPP